LWLSLSAAAAAALVSVGCSSSDEPGPAGSAGSGDGHGGGATGKAGSAASEAGEAAVGGEPGEPDGMGDGGGRTDIPSGGTGGTGATGGSIAGGTNGGDAGQTGEGGAGGAPDAVDPEVAAAQARAIALINGLEMTRRCTSCHDVSYQGSGFYPNITPDIDTGIGSWSAEEIKAAIHDGKDNDGKTLCATMERYPFNDAQLADLATYLQHLPPIKKKISAKCPSLP